MREYIYIDCILVVIFPFPYTTKWQNKKLSSQNSRVKQKQKQKTISCKLGRRQRWKKREHRIGLILWVMHDVYYYYY